MRLVPALLTSLVLVLPGAAALAQDSPPQQPPGQEGGPPAGGRGQRGGGMGQLSPEQQKTVWEMQARHVSAGAGLSDVETPQVIAAYQLTREDHNKAMAEIRAKAAEARGGRGRARGGQGGDGTAGGEGGGAGGEGGAGSGGAPGGAGGGAGGPPPAQGEMQKAVAEATRHERTTFETALNGFLKPEQTTKVLEGLGNYDAQWDRLTWALLSLNLDAGTLSKAMDSTQAYTTAVIKARDVTDPQARREANTTARQKMQDEMKSILNEEQYGKFQAASGPQGGGRVGPRGGGEGGAGGGRRGGGGGAGGQGGGAGGEGGGEGGAGGSGGR